MLSVIAGRVGAETQDPIRDKGAGRPGLGHIAPSGCASLLICRTEVVVKAALWSCEASQITVNKQQVLRKEPGPREDGSPRSRCYSSCLRGRVCSKTETFSGEPWIRASFVPSLPWRLRS